jgi:predicted transcriptional regulator
MIIRSPHERNYTCINNDVLNDYSLGLRNLGLLTHLLSKPDNWNISVLQLAKIWGVGRDSIHKILNTLIEQGYARREKTRTGHINWYISEVKKPVTEKPETPVNKPHTENTYQAIKPHTENQYQAPEQAQAQVFTPHTENQDMATPDKPTEIGAKTAGGPVLMPHTEKPDTESKALISNIDKQVPISNDGYIDDAREDLKNVDGLTPAQITAKLIDRKLMHCNPDNQNFRQLIIDGATLADFYEATTIATQKPAGFKYMLTTAKGILQERKSQDTAGNGPGSNSTLNTHNYGDNHEKQGYNNATHSSTGRKQSAIEKMEQNTRELREIRSQEARVI